MELGLSTRLLLYGNASAVRLVYARGNVVVLNSIEVAQGILAHLLLYHSNFFLLVFPSAPREVSRLVYRIIRLLLCHLPLRLGLMQHLLLCWLVPMLCHNFRLRTLFVESVYSIDCRLRSEILLVRTVSISRSEILLEAFLLNGTAFCCGLRHK